MENIGEKESKAVFGKVARKQDICVIGICDASCHQENPTIAEAMMIVGNMKNKRTAPVYWKSGEVNKVCTLSKASGTRGVMLVVDDAKIVVDQLRDLLNAEIKVKVFTDLCPLLETLGHTSQVAENGLR